MDARIPPGTTITASTDQNEITFTIDPSAVANPADWDPGLARLPWVAGVLIAFDPRVTVRHDRQLRGREPLLVASVVAALHANMAPEALCAELRSRFGAVRFEVVTP